MLSPHWGIWDLTPVRPTHSWCPHTGCWSRRMGGGVPQPPPRPGEQPFPVKTHRSQPWSRAFPGRTQGGHWRRLSARVFELPQAPGPWNPSQATASALGAGCTQEGRPDTMLTEEGTGTHGVGLTVPRAHSVPSELPARLPRQAGNPDPAPSSPSQPPWEGVGTLGRATDRTPPRQPGAHR